MNHWRVLRCSSGFEFDVSARAIADGVEAYVPSFVERHRSRYGRKGEIRETRRPMWPSYFLADFSRMYEIITDFSPEAYTRSLGVGRRGAQVVSGPPLSAAQIEAVRATEFLVSSVSDRTIIQPGALVEFWRGVLSGARAEVLKTKGRSAVVAMLGSGKVLRVNITDLENVGNDSRETCTGT